MKTPSTKNKLILGTAIVAVFLIAFGFSTFSSSISLPSFSSKESLLKEETGINYNTTEEEEEVPHFNLFSIINKFIPH